MTETSHAATRIPTSDFRLGSVIVRSASILRRHLLTFLIVSLIANSPAPLFVNVETTGPVGFEDFSDPLQAAFGSLLWVMFQFVSMGMLGNFAQAVIIHRAFQDMRLRGAVSLIESLNVSLRQFGTLIGLALAALLVVLGLLLVVPGFILAATWFAALPVCVIEQLGLSASLRRSHELTKGHRWKLFGLMLLLIIPNLVGWGVGYWLRAAAMPVAGTAGELLFDTVSTACTAAALIASYHELRVIKEGADFEQVAVVFD
jgi:Membrane domain of glycerophosphoryl diester phosphodiesterase